MQNSYIAISVETAEIAEITEIAETNETAETAETVTQLILSLLRELACFASLTTPRNHNLTLYNVYQGPGRIQKDP